ncbi:hypothetical protein D3C75_997010 [compost metagenome]
MLISVADRVSGKSVFTLPLIWTRHCSTLSSKTKLAKWMNSTGMSEKVSCALSGR